MSVDPMDENRDIVKHRWEEHWERNTSVEEKASLIGKWLRRKRMEIVSKIFSNLDPSMSVIDLGCGSGNTLFIMREQGLKNSIGIDFVKASISRCSVLGFEQNKDVFLMDAGLTTFPDQHFDVVFSEGLWEHFQDPEPFILEAARIAKEYVIVVQPNHFSLFGRLMHLGWHLLGGHGVEEYSFRISYFVDSLEKNGFYLAQTHSTILKEQMILVFRRTHDE